MVTPELNQNASEGQPKRKKRARRLCLDDVNAIAERVVKYRMTETEAAENIGILPVQWFLFKSRVKVKPEFESAITRVRAANIVNVVDSIDRAGEDYQSGDYVKRGDWRAKAWLAEHVLAPERFGKVAGDAAPAQHTTFNLTIAQDLRKLAYGQADSVIECPTVKAIDDTSIKQ